MAEATSAVPASETSTPAPPKDCIFCNGGFITTTPQHKDEDLVAVDDKYPSGRTHWLVMPLQHIRSVEALTAAHLPLYRRMLEVSEQLLQKHYPDLTPETRPQRLRRGFHRGHRELSVLGLTKIQLPEIISVKHLHLHVIVDPHFSKDHFKYPLWNKLVFISSDEVLKKLEAEEKGMRNDAGDGGQVAICAKT